MTNALPFESPLAPEKNSAADAARVAVALAAGVLLWVAFHRGPPPSAAVLGILFLQAAVVSFPPINRWLAVKLEALDALCPRRRAGISTALGALATAYLYFSAREQGRDFFPKFHDEYMHLVQARLLSRGWLWAAPHPLPEFFETFHVFVTPVYAGQHFPGAAMFYVPGMWLGLPWWVTSLALAGSTVGLTHRVIAELCGGASGILAAFMLLGTLEFRYVSLMVLSNPPALLLGLLMLWAWLRWRRDCRAGWAIALGLFAGWAAITRPQDALCFAVPIGAAMLLEPRRRALQKFLPTALAIVAGAAPFLAVQLVFDRGVTGRWLTTPHQHYGHLFYPGVTYGLREPALGARPATELPQKLDYYDGFIIPRMRGYTPRTAWRQWVGERFPTLFEAALPSPLLLLFLPPGLLALSRRRWVPVAVLPLFVAFYALNIMFASVYAVLVTVAAIPLAILGVERTRRALEAGFPVLSRRVRPVAFTLLLGLSFGALPQLNPSATEQFAAPVLRDVERSLAKLPGRAVVFFHYQAGVDVHQEPVYNIDAANIDDQRIVRAQDLGPEENLKLLRYYARFQPDRKAYLFDRATRTLTAIDRK